MCPYQWLISKHLKLRTTDATPSLTTCEPLVTVFHLHSDQHNNRSVASCAIVSIGIVCISTLVYCTHEVVCWKGYTCSTGWFSFIIIYPQNIAMFDYALTCVVLVLFLLLLYCYYHYYCDSSHYYDDLVVSLSTISNRIIHIILHDYHKVVLPPSCKLAHNPHQV